MLNLATSPHIFALSGDGSDRTAFLRTLITVACARGWRVVIAGPKASTDWQGFSDWPGVDTIASTAAAMEQLITQVKTDMDQRHDALAAHRVSEDQLLPTLAVIHEASQCWAALHDAHSPRIGPGRRSTPSSAERASRAIASRGRRPGPTWPSPTTP